MFRNKRIHWVPAVCQCVTQFVCCWHVFLPFYKNLNFFKGILLRCNWYIKNGTHLCIHLDHFFFFGGIYRWLKFKKKFFFKQRIIALQYWFLPYSNTNWPKVYVYPCAYTGDTTSTIRMSVTSQNFLIFFCSFFVCVQTQHIYNLNIF